MLYRLTADEPSKKFASSAYIDDATGCFHNLLNVKDSCILEEIEAEITLCISRELHDKNIIIGDFDFAHIKNIHRVLFQNIYGWAGKPRTVNISKNNKGFCHSLAIERNIYCILYNFKKENMLIGLPHEEFIKKVARLLVEVNDVHPFREGNGRAQNEFIRQVGLNAGYEVFLHKFSGRDKKLRSVWINAIKSTHEGDFTDLLAILDENTNKLPPDFREKIKIERNVQTAFDDSERFPHNGFNL